MPWRMQSRGRPTRFRAWDPTVTTPCCSNLLAFQLANKSCAITTAALAHGASLKEVGSGRLTPAEVTASSRRSVPQTLGASWDVRQQPPRELIPPLLPQVFPVATVRAVLMEFVQKEQLHQTEPLDSNLEASRTHFGRRP